MRSIAVGIILASVATIGASARGPQPLQSCNGIGVVPAPGTKVLCTKLVDFSGTCGKPNYPGIAGFEDVAVLLNPWEEDSITLHEVQVSAVLMGPILNGQPQPANLNIGIFSGNSYNYDPMTPYEFAYSYGVTAVVVKAHDRFPNGTGMQFPGKARSRDTGPTGPRVDVHVDCGPHGSSYAGKWFLAYTLNRRR